VVFKRRGTAIAAEMFGVLSTSSGGDRNARRRQCFDKAALLDRATPDSNTWQPVTTGLAIVAVVDGAPVEIDGPRSVRLAEDEGCGLGE